MIYKNTYHASFWKDGLWLFILVALFGLAFFFSGIWTFVYIIFGNSSKITLNEPVIFVMFMLLALVFIFSGYIIIYVYWKRWKGKISFTDGAIIYSYPKSICVLFYKNLIIPYKDIIRISLGPVILDKIYPGSSRKVSGQYYSVYSSTSVFITYRVNNRIRNIYFPVFHNDEYCQEYKKIIEKENFHQNPAVFIFEKRS